MSDDIVNRLRTWLYETPVCMEAADEIERLMAENERLSSELALERKSVERLHVVLRDAGMLHAYQQRMDNE